MQYILSELEYKALKDAATAKDDGTVADLQYLCTLVADHMLIKGWYGEMKPWGCILTDQGQEWYCDDCPVQDKCPNLHKEWSK